MSHAMHLDVIDTLAVFEACERNWDAVYAADPDAHYFLSWGWLRQLLGEGGHNWCVLAVKAAPSDGDYVAFFPLRRRVRYSHSARRFCSEIQMAGSIAWADYTGFICHPAHEAAIAVFGAHLRQMGWRRLTLKNFRASEKRLHALVSALSGPAFHQDDRPRIGKTDNTNLLVCPYVELPDDFEHYLQARLSANARQKVRRFLRKIDQSDTLRFTLASAETYTRDIEILISFWHRKWGERKGARADELARRYRSILHLAWSGGTLFLPVLWHGTRPLGALGSFVDREKQSLLFFVAGRDESCNVPPPGLVLHAHSIRWAIDNGLRCYDFLRGDEGYKYAFGATDRQIRYIVIDTRDHAQTHDPSDPQSLDAIVRHATRHHESGRLDVAECGYRQVLAAAPDHPAALRYYGRLLIQSDRYAEADPIFARLAHATPDG